MKKDSIYCSYFKQTAPIWILLIICIYCVLACEFESLRIELFSINKDISFVEKINNIIKNLSYSYIAGVIFFSLSDTIPFLRRMRIANRGVKKLLCQIVNAIDDFSLSINQNKWDEKTNPKQVFEDFTGGEYIENAPPTKLTSDKIALIDKLVNTINVGTDFIISKELYISTDLIDDVDSIKSNEYFLFISSIPDNAKNELYVTADKIVAIFDNIIEIKRTMLKYL